MKKRSSKKFSLHRETLLSLSALKGFKGAADSIDVDCTMKCVSGPFYECFHTFELGCVRD